MAVAAGALVRGSASRVDLLLVGAVATNRVTALMKKIEKVEDVEKVLLEKDPRGISLTMKSRGRTMQLYLR